MSSSHAASTSMSSSIARVDFRAFQRGSPAEKAQCAKEITDALRSLGVVLLVGHPLDPELTSRVFDHSRAFFLLPDEEKQRVRYDDPRSNRGWIPCGGEALSMKGRETDRFPVATAEGLAVASSAESAEVTSATGSQSTQNSKPKAVFGDGKESLEIGPESDPCYHNKWPCDCERHSFSGSTFRETMHDFQRACLELWVYTRHINMSVHA